MIRLAPILIACAAITLPLSVSAQIDESEQIQSLMEEVAALVQKGDLVSLGNIYAPGRGVHIIEGSGVNHGWEDYRDNHLKPELQAFQNMEYRYFAIEPQVRGSIAYTAFRYELGADTSSGQFKTAGRGTAVLEKMEGKWRIVHMHTSGRRIE